MKQYKTSAKGNEKAAKAHSVTTRQEIDEIAKHIAVHIEKNPAKAAKLFETWLNGRSKETVKKKSA